MTEAQQGGTGSTRTYAHIDDICDCLRRGLHEVCDAFTPPEAAGNHFREARIELLRGIRALIDHRIDHLSRTKNSGTHVVVE